LVANKLLILNLDPTPFLILRRSARSAGRLEGSDGGLHKYREHG
jgi:hypothetical protein